MRVSEENRAEFCGAIRVAVFHLASCWDALREAELLADTEIESGAIQGLTGDIDDPMDAYLISNDQVFESLEEVDADA